MTSPYSVHPSVTYAQAILENLHDKTGRTVEEWLELARGSHLATAKERQAWIKSTHRLGATSARMIADLSLGQGAKETDPEAYLRAAAGYVEAMYSGGKAALRPLHDALIRLGRGLGSDVRVSPCKTIVPLYRRHVFAQIKPATRTRIDLGLALRGAADGPSDRLIDTGGLEKGDRITHRIPIASLDEIDTEVDRWLSIAYGLDA